mmetsp:Transcript_2457/g.3596  ORF Transcript_2457/g.3596 Transcript_2457/m.3596 type:complete len:205 (-) Transcript_2457:612-1226(-)
MRAPLTTTLISDPENPSVIDANSLKSFSCNEFGVFPILILKISARACADGRGMYTRFSKRRSIAGSSSQGTFVAPRTNTRPSLAFPPTPSIWTMNSVFTLRDASFSPSLLALTRESTSSMNIILGDFFRATKKRFFTNFSLSPWNFERRLEDEHDMKVESASVATALARWLLPVPGGPNRRMPRHGFSFPTKRFGNFTGRMTAS